MDREKHAFFTAVQRMERESKERRKKDIEAHKRHMLASMTGGWARNQKTRPTTVTLPKMSWEEER
jgi:hypothetical protein